MNLDMRMADLLQPYQEFFVVERLEFMGHTHFREWTVKELTIDRNGNGIILSGNMLIITNDMFLVKGTPENGPQVDITADLSILIEDMGGEAVESVIGLLGS